MSRTDGSTTAWRVSAVSMARTWSRRRAASSKFSASAASAIRSASRRRTSSNRPRRNSTTASTRRPYSSAGTRPTQGPRQRCIWHSRQGRVRTRNWESLHVRSPKCRFTSAWVPRTDEADA